MEAQALRACTTTSTYICTNMVLLVQRRETTSTLKSQTNSRFAPRKNTTQIWEEGRTSAEKCIYCIAMKFSSLFYLLYARILWCYGMEENITISLCICTAVQLSLCLDVLVNPGHISLVSCYLLLSCIYLHFRNNGQRLDWVVVLLILLVLW